MDDKIRNEILKNFTADKLKNASQEYIKKMDYLATCEGVLTDGFIMHDYVRDEYDENHMMYKCGAPLSIESDGITVTYEFLIEYDIRKPNEGIYYGCKALLDENIKTEKGYKTSLEFIEEQFEKVRDRLVAVLSNTFPGKDFSKRLLLTDNAYSSTYWPFWIRLNSEEDIVKVAARATRLIRNVYKKDLGLTELEQYSRRSDWRDTKCAKEYDPEQMKIETETAFTEDAWNNANQHLKNKKHREKAKEIVDGFIKAKVENGIICKDDCYERAWKLIGKMGRKEFRNQAKDYYTEQIQKEIGECNDGIKNYGKVIDNTKEEKGKKSFRKIINELRKDIKDYKKVPWYLIEISILDSKGRRFKNMKNP